MDRAIAGRAKKGGHSLSRRSSKHWRARQVFINAMRCDMLNLQGNVINSGEYMARINPLLRRGYYYDWTTGLYYLQSRYYDPVVGRFVNADADAAWVLGVDEGMLGWNVYLHAAIEPAIQVYSHVVLPANNLFAKIVGGEVVIAVTNGKLDFGTWEQIFYGEFDGMRDKRVLVKIIGE